MTRYDAAFFEYVNSGALRSARRLLPVLLEQMTIDSVLDVGCGQGAWLTVWEELGVAEVMGIDGDYVDRDQLLINKDFFLPQDLTRQFDLKRRFDLVQSLEVAEHLPEESAAGFVDSLVRHGDLVLFSAAPKGQGGDNHINEQDYDYWRGLFARHGYVAIDYVRPLVRGDRQIEPWYRFNPVLYASEDRFLRLPEAIRSCRVLDSEKLRDMSPPLYRIRKALVRLLPVPVMTRLAKYKERLVVRIRGARTAGRLTV